jgi:GxxExxY protein
MGMPEDLLAKLLRPVAPEPEPQIDRLAHQVIGAAIEVHRQLGPGLLESVYEEAMSIELTLRGIAFTRQPEVAIDYKGKPVGQGRLDFLIAGCLVVELKAVEMLAPIHSAQLISYLRITKRNLGLLINFNVPLLKEGIRRVVLS